MSVTIPKTQLAIVGAEGQTEVIKEIPVVEPKGDEILVKVIAWSAQQGPEFFPAIVDSISGYDFAGIVVKVGKDVTLFDIGDHVSSMCVGGMKVIPATGAYCEYAISREHVSYKHKNPLKSTDEELIDIGNVVGTFELASVIPNSLVTVGTSLWGGFGLRKGEDYSNDIFLVYSGGSAIGLIMIQIATWLGFKDVVATASPSKFELVKKLGASSVFDYHDDDVAEQIRSKYGDDINYAVDTRGQVDSFTKTYNATTRTKKLKIQNLLRVQESDLTDIVKKTNEVECIFTSSFLAYGDELLFLGNLVQPPPFMVEGAKLFQKQITPLLDEKKLFFIGLKKIPGGLHGLIKHCQEEAPSNYRLFARSEEIKK